MVNLDELETLIRLLSDQYKVEISDVVLAKLNKNVNAQFDYNNRRILVNSDIDDINTAIIAVYHEFRHAWQEKYYPDIFWWWMEQLTKNEEFYMKYYRTLFNSLEADALLFGYSLGTKNRQDLLDMYTSTDLEDLINDGTCDFALEYLEHLENERNRN